jgi:phosphoribosylglycinamide formyltransferase-1
VNKTARFIGEAIQPDAGTFDATRMAGGEPGLPEVFYWKGQAIRIVNVVLSWRETGPCDHGSAEKYIRKHWYEVATDTGQIMKIYFDRHPRPGKMKVRWWLFTILE